MQKYKVLPQTMSHFLAIGINSHQGDYIYGFKDHSNEMLKDVIIEKKKEEMMCLTFS